MTVGIDGYQVNVRFSIPSIYINLYQGDTQVGRIDVDDPALFNLAAFAIEQLSTSDNIDWDDAAGVLQFGSKMTGQG